MQNLFLFTIVTDWESNNISALALKEVQTWVEITRLWGQQADRNG